MSFLTFMSSGAGRLTRIVAGAGLMVVGGLLGGGWFALIVVGAVPLAAGIFDFCLFAPLAHRPFRGRQFRQSART